MKTNTFVHLYVAILLTSMPIVGSANTFPSQSNSDPQKTQGQPEVSLEVLEATLPKPEVRLADSVDIVLKDGTRFSVPNIPSKDEMRRALGLESTDKEKAQAISKGETLDLIDPLKEFDGLDDASKRRFDELRLTILAKAAQVLHKTEFAISTGSLVGDKLSAVKASVVKAFGKKVETQETAKKLFKDRGHAGVEGMLNGINYKLLSQAPLLIQSNEFGLTLSFGVVAEAGIRNKGFGGLQEVGLSFGYNKQDRAFVFEIFHNSESFSGSKMLVTVLGVIGKLGVNIEAKNGTKPTSILKGSSFYPPMIPGYSSLSAGSFSTGMSTTLGFPPSPFADLLTFTNDSRRTPLLRITVSPLVKGFVRVQLAPVGDIARGLLVRTKDFLSEVRYLVLKTKRGACGKVFAAY